MHEIVAAPGWKTDLRERFDQSPGSDVLGHQHAPSERDALATQRRLNGEAAVAQSRSPTARPSYPSCGEPAFPVRQGAVVVQNAPLVQRRASDQVRREIGGATLRERVCQYV